MTLTINTNHVSNLVQNNLTGATARLNSAIERLTTGFKINHAADNAAGYSISTKYSSQLSSYSVAQNNTAMGMDLLTTADESLSLITSHLSRMRDLSEQAANGTYGQESIDAIQAEFALRIKEIDRIVSSAEYNGIKLFNEPPKTFDDEIVILTEEEAVTQGYTVIKNADDLQAMKNNLSGKYILMEDIDLSGYDWSVVGDINNPFTGELNGNGHTISNLYLNRDTYDYVGLIGRTQGATISNLGVVNADVTGKMYVGGLTGYSYGSSITNCYVTGSVSGYGDVGGIAGCNIFNSIMKNSYSLASVKADNYSAGGIVGHNSDHSTIEGCFAKGDISASMSAGGLIGRNTESIISKSYSTGSVSAPNEVGGLIGRVESGNISSCYYDLETSGQSAGVGQGDDSGVTGLSSAELREMILNATLPGASLLQTNQNNEIYFQVGIHSDGSAQIMIDTSFEFSVEGMAISSSESARQMLNRIDELMSIVNAKQTDIGSAYNRLESALDSIGVSIDNLTSSLSTIKDADIGEVSSVYIREQILQQASATLLATANQTPAIALQLL